VRLRLAVPDEYVTPEFIEAGLEAATRGNQAMLARGASPLASQLIARGAKWKPENFSDGEHFDLLPTIAGRMWGDCDDWAPGVAAELRHTGEDPGAKAIIRKSGPKRWHALVQTSDGAIHDPSRWAGMPLGGAMKRPAVARVKFPKGAVGAFIAKPSGDGWSARCDLPIPEGHICGVAHGAPSAADALGRAAYAVGGCHVAGEELIQRCNDVVGYMLEDLASGRGVAAAPTRRLRNGAIVQRPQPNVVVVGF
jgi:hypothetical protein